MSIEISDAILPIGLDPNIAATVAGILANARLEGWTVEPLKWADASVRMLFFTARYPTGKSLFLMCGESGLVDRLRNLLAH